MSNWYITVNMRRRRRRRVLVTDGTRDLHVVIGVADQHNADTFE